MSKTSTVTLARAAMATRFEIVLYGRDPVRLRAAGEAALDEIERLEAQLSLYRATSEIAHINACAAHELVRVEPSLFRLLQQAKSLSEETNGAFDITIAPLMRLWGLMRGENVPPSRAVGRAYPRAASGSTGGASVPASHLPPTSAQLKKTRAHVGMHLIELDPANFTIRFLRPGVMLDLGAIGKGYAIDQAAEILRDAGVKSALIHGGTSTVYAIGAPPNAPAWNIAIQHPDNEPSLHPRGRPGDSAADQFPIFSGRAKPPAEPLPTSPSPPLEERAGERRPFTPLHTDSTTTPTAPLAIVPLRDEALSVSAIWGKTLKIGRKTYGHILDPRTGQPVQHAALSAVILPSATETDALSTALLTLGTSGHKLISKLRPKMRSLVLEPTKTAYKISSKGIATERHKGPRNSSKNFVET
jgi:thiamine biosynthesis lipoprotein ApbE